MSTNILLQDRKIIEISGEDRKSFLQGLITNDINKASKENLIYSAMLDARGRFLYDFFIFEDGEKLILDSLEERCDEIIKKLSMYKLRAKVEIKKNEELKVFWTKEKPSKSYSFQDPRHSNLGFRIYQKSIEDKKTEECLTYHLTRIENKIPESEYDLTKEKSLILEFGFDELNAIDYEKGCYVGQELTARTHHLGEIRKKIFHIKISNKKINNKDIAHLKGEKISCEGKSIGVILSSVFNNNELHALALIKFSQDPDFATKLEYEENKVFLVN